MRPKTKNRVVKSFNAEPDTWEKVIQRANGANLSDTLNELILKGLEYDNKIKKLTSLDIVEWMLMGYNKNHPEAPKTLITRKVNKD